MKELDLLSFPATVVCAVFSCFDDLVDVVRLDSAFCHHRHREAWLALLESKPFALTCPVDVSDDNELSWVLKKSVKCLYVGFRLDIKAYKNVSEYLRGMGSSIRKVHFDGETKTHEILLVALHCRHLTTLYIKSLTVSCSMREVLLQNPNLQEILFLNVNSSEADIFERISLHRLQTMHVKNTHSSFGGFLWHETAFSDSLHTVLWDGSSFSTADLNALFKNCPGIRGFSANHVPLKTEQIVLLGKDIVNLSLSSNKTLTDTQLLSIVKRLSSLRTLNVQDCPLLTDVCLRHLADHVGESLEVLYIDIKHPESAETEDILEGFSQKCTKLKYINMNCGEWVLCTGNGTSLLVCGCPQLETLVVNEYSTVTASSRRFAAKLRPALKILVHSADTAFDIKSMPID